jgi:hypothetical protein
VNGTIPPGEYAVVTQEGPWEAAALWDFDPAYVSSGSWLRKNVSERSKAASDWLASTLKRADWLFLRSRGLDTLLKLPEVILSDLETPRQPAAQARIAARSGFTPTMFITRVRL